MPLQPQNISVSFGRGVDTKTDPKQVIAGKLTLLENGVFTSPLRIRKRYGNVSLGQTIEGGGTLSAGSALMAYKNELAMLSGSEFYSYSSATGRWSDKGSAVSLEATSLPVIRNSYQQTTPDVAYHSTGLLLFTWEDSRGGSRYSIIDRATGQAIVQDASISATATKPKPFAIGNYLIILFVDSTNLRRIAIPVLTPTVPGAATDVATDLNTTNAVYDATVLGQRLFIAYNNRATAPGGVSCLYLNTSLALSSAVTGAAEAASVAINVAGDTTLNEVWVSYYNGTAVKGFVRNYDLSTQVLAATVIETTANVRNVAGAVSNGSGTFWYEISAAATYNYLIRKNTLTRTGTVGTAAVFVRSVGLASKPFTYGTGTYLTVAYQSTLQPTYFVMDSSAKIVAKLSPGNGGGLTSKSILPEVVVPAAGVFSFAFLQKDLLTTVTGAIYTQTGVQVGTLDFTSQNAYIDAELGGNLHITGGIVSMYDGQSLLEHSFHLYPENITTVVGAAGSMADATYQYFVVLAWPDNQGQIHRSTPSVGYSVTVSGKGGAGSVAHTIPTLRLTEKRGTRTPVRIEIYRTEANLQGPPGGIAYLVTSVTSPTLNDTTVDTVSFTDTTSDANLVGNPYIYTTGGVVRNAASPAAALIATYGNRVVILSSEDKLSFWFSKEVVDGAPVEFSDLLTGRVDRRGGDVTAMIQMDDKLIFFKGANIFYMAGEGPDSKGAQNDFTTPALVNTDAGCTNPRSVVLTPEGVMFDSAKGKYLLDRSLSVRYVGKAVEAYNGVAVSSAMQIPNTNQVRFTLSSGVALVYDYSVKDEEGLGQWSIFTNCAAVDSAPFNCTYTVTQPDGTQKQVTQPMFTYLQSNGQVLQETPNVFTDNGRFIRLKLVTSWLSFAGLQGFQRVRRLMLLGDYISAHKLYLQVAYDFNPYATQDHLFDAGAILGTGSYGSDATYGAGAVYGGAYPEYEWELHLKQQKCTAVQISIEDSQASNFGEGLSLSAIVFEVGAKQGMKKLPAARRSA